MESWRTVLAWGFVVVLAGVVVWGFSRSEATDDTSANAVATTSTTTTTTSTSTTTTQPTTTTAPATTTSLGAEEARVEEIRAVVQDLWFRWFDAIYRENPEAIREIVVRDASYEAAVEAMGNVDFTARPTREDVRITNFELLLDEAACVAVHVALDLSGFRTPRESSTEVISTLWHDEQYGWRFFQHWQYRNDLWERDCDQVS